MNIVYDCHISETMGYPERGYCFRRGDDALVMWQGYFSDLMKGMWKVYGYEFDSDDPAHPHLDQVPLLWVWNEEGSVGTDGAVRIAELPATARAFRDAVAELRRTGPNQADSAKHGEALAAFLEQAVACGQDVSVEEQRGVAPTLKQTAGHDSFVGFQALRRPAELELGRSAAEDAANVQLVQTDVREPADSAVRR